MRILFLALAILFFSALLQADEAKVRIALKWFYQYQFAGYIMAQEKGYFSEAGLEVELLERDPSKNHIMQVIEGEAEYGVADSSILVYRAKGYPVKVIASIFQHNAMVLISRQDSGIVSPYEMKGKRISYQEGVDDAIFTSMFAYADLREGDYVKVPMDFSYESIINGDVDVIAAYITDQPYWIEKRGVKLNIINPLSYGIDLYGDNLFTTEKEIANHPERVAKLKAAVLKGWAYALEHKEETVRTIIEKYKPDLDFDQLMFEARTTEPLIAPHHVALGFTSKERFRIIASFYNDLGLSQKAMEEAVDEIIYDPDKKEDVLQTYLTAFSVAGGVMLIVLMLLYLYNKRLQSLVRSRTKELEKATHEARKAAEAKAQFLANMSHEIRTPMNAILGFVEQLAKNEPEEGRRKQFAIIKNSGHTLLGILNDILDLSKIESGKMGIDVQPLRTAMPFEETAALFHDLLEEKQITFSLNLSETLPARIEADDIRIKQVVFNLLSNAVKFTPMQGRISIDVGMSDPQTLHCSVTDSGMGIAPENIKKIFNIFEQEDSSTTRRFGGTGLGLAISSRLVEMMGGRLDVESEPGRGSRFFFDLPVKPLGHEKAADVHAGDVSEPVSSAVSGKVLYVEDNKTNQLLMGVILDEMELDYEIASDGVEGVEAYKNGDFDLILMDENMPNMNGIEAAMVIREEARLNGRPYVPIVAVTANALSGDRERFIAAGMDDYLSKPFTEEQVRALVGKFLGGAQ